MTEILDKSYPNNYRDDTDNIHIVNGLLIEIHTR